MELRDVDKDALLRMIRAVVQKTEETYRPIRAKMTAEQVNNDLVLDRLCRCRDALINAEMAILEVGLPLPEGEATEGSAALIEIPDDDALTRMREALSLLYRTDRGESDTALLLSRAIRSTDPNPSEGGSVVWEMSDDDVIHTTPPE